MKNNLSEIKEHINTKYGDFTGVIQIDGHGNITSLYDLCKDYGIDTEEIFLVGFRLTEHGGIGIAQNDFVYCKILYVNKSKYGYSFDEISRKIQESEKIVLEQRNISLKYNDLRKYIKRFDFIVTTELTRYTKEIEINEE